MSSEPPEEPLSRSEFSTLSPASPKPIHFPTPTAIPVLDMQTDVGFNQMEPHMSDPATRNTEQRPDIWQDPNDRPAEPAEDNADASPFSTGAEAQLQEAEEGGTNDTAARPQMESGTTVEEITTNTTASQPTPIPYVSSNAFGQTAGHAATIEAHPGDTMNTLSDPSTSAAKESAPTLPDAFSAQTDEVKLDQLPSQPESGTVDIQGLLNTLQTAPATNDASFAANGMTTAQSTKPHLPSLEHPDAPPAPGVDTGSSLLSASNLGLPPSGLPPRPPPQEQPLINPNYAHSQHIRDYHPHATHSAYQPHGHTSSQGNTADPNSRSFVPPVGSPGDNAQTPNGVAPSETYSPALAAANRQGSYAASSAPAVPGFTPNQGIFPSQYPSAGADPPAAASGANRHAGRRPEDRPWDAEVQKKYDRFLEAERNYVAEGRWEQFPQGSRLFVGNLSSEKVTKRDIFHVFHTYGELAQISIKQAYGFVQFLRAEDCTQALEAEQGTQIREKRIHLEVSKPQKNRPQPQRRSRSPPGRQGANNDRYSGGRGGNNRVGRDDYRPGRRSPSPRGYRDRYDERYRRRSPTPPSYGGRGGGRYRSPSPRQDEGDDLPLPRRQPRDVPDVQIVVLDNLDRDFISWVEKAFSSRNVRVDVLLLSPRLSEQAVVRRQIVEGVLAVVKLTRQNQDTGQIGLQIFDRSAGAGSVRFEEYDNLPPPTCAELVLREKSKVATPAYGGGYQPAQSLPPPPQQQYGYQQPGYPPQQATGYPPNYVQPPQQSVPPAGSVPPHLQSLITNLDPTNLQSLLSAMNTPQSARNTYGGTPNSAVQVLQQNPQLAGYLQQQQQVQQGQPPASATGTGQVNMQEILARLGGGGGR